jgi:uncharacterized protein YdiU (UPF0061 family)
MEFINSYTNLGDQFYSQTNIESFEGPFLIDYNEGLAKELGLDISGEEALQYFSGNKSFKGAKTISTVYAGHQFGSYVAQLGDGRAHLLGEIKSPSGETWEIQLKGSGKTPYSRFGDGKAVLRSTIREYLASEALHYLGIPTTRALCIVGSDENVMREGIEKAAMVTRVAPSFIRFGHFEFFTHSGKPELTKKLADYVIDKYFRECGWGKERYEKFLYEVVSSTALMIAKWQAYGFTHGVMNTDNMSILGLTIDYGPYGFLDEYNPAYVPNHSDYSGRYAYANQPQIAFWNLYALAHALTPVVPLERSGPILELFKTILVKEFTEIMRRKLGLKERRNNDKKLVQDLFEVLAKFEVDHTIFFRNLCDYKIDGDNSKIYNMFRSTGILKDWEKRYIVRLKQEGWSELNKENNAIDEERSTRMKQYNPKYILRNYMAENAIRNATYAKDYTEIKNLMKLLKSPYAEQPEFEHYAQTPPDWAKSICISCSS